MDSEADRAAASGEIQNQREAPSSRRDARMAEPQFDDLDLTRGKPLKVEHCRQEGGVRKKWRDVLNKTSSDLEVSTIMRRTTSESCPICLGDFQPDEIILKTACKHHFHKECMEDYRRHSS